MWLLTGPQPLKRSLVVNDNDEHQPEMPKSIKELKPIPPNPPRWEPNTDPSSITIPGLDTSASVNDQIDQIDQLITLKLQVLFLMVSNALDPNSW